MLTGCGDPGDEGSPDLNADASVAQGMTPDTGVGVTNLPPVTNPATNPPVTNPPAGGDAGTTTIPRIDAGAVAMPDGGGTTPITPVATGGADPVIPKPTGACPSFKSGTQMIGGLSVEVYAGPKSSGTKAPLVFFWHGTGGAGKDAERLPAAMRKEIMDAGGILISPSTTTMMGEDVTFFLGVWFTTGDFAWADDIAACAVQDYNVDPRRIYATGCSAGGLMAGVMAFQRSNYLAASAPNSGGVAVPGQDKPQDPKRVAASMTMHGAKGVDNVFIDFADSSATQYTSAKGKASIVIDCEHPSGHCMAPPDLQVAAWQFMKDHPFGVSPEPYANGLPASFPTYCMVK